MADRQVGISVKTTVNDSQLRSLKDNFRGVTQGMGNDLDELSISTQKYMENIRRAQEIGATPAYRQQLRQQQLELKQSIDVRLREIRREGDEAVAQINRQILATKRFVYERQQTLKQSGIADDERSRLSQEISQQQAELRRLQLERQQALQVQRERMVPASQLRERVEATGGTVRELPSTMLGGAGAKLGSLLKTGVALAGIGSIAQLMAQGIKDAYTTEIELGDLSKRVKEVKETYDDFRLRILQVGDALGYTNEEMRELARQAAALVGAKDLQTTMQTTASFARTYGLQAPFVNDMLGQMFQAGVTGGVTAQMRPQEFVAMLSEAIGSGRMAGREEELIRSIENLVAATQRTLVTPPNVQAMFEVMTTLNQSGIQGLTGERGAQLLNQLSQGDHAAGRRRGRGSVYVPGAECWRCRTGIFQVPAAAGARGIRDDGGCQQDDPGGFLARTDREVWQEDQYRSCNGASCLSGFALAGRGGDSFQSFGMESEPIYRFPGRYNERW